MRVQNETKTVLLEQLTALRVRHAELEESRGDGQYRMLFEGSQDAVYISTRDGRVLEANQAALDLFGYTREEILQLKAERLYADPDDWQLSRQRVGEAGSFKDYEVRLQKKSGVEMDCLLTSSVVRDSKGVILGYQWMIRDVTERKQAEKLFPLLLESAPFGLVVVNQAGEMTLVNSQTEAMFGYSRKELLGEPVEILIPQHLRDRHAAHRTDYLAEPRTITSLGRELCGLRKDGSTVSIEIGLSPVSVSGEVMIAAAIVNVTARMQREKALRESEARYRMLVEHSPYCIHEIDRDGRFVSMNKAGLANLGVNAESDVVGTPYLDVVAEEYRARIGGVLRQAWEGQSSEFEYRTRNGRHFRSTMVPITDDAGVVIRLMGLTQDITEQVRREKALHALVEGTASAIGDMFFPQLVRILADTLNMRFAFVSALVDKSGERLRIISLWEGTGYGKTFEFAVQGTPGEQVISKGLAVYPARVQELFPGDNWLRAVGIESYLAIALCDSQGSPLGHLGVADCKPMAQSDFAESILRIFAARAASELERRQAESVVWESRERLRKLAARLHAVREEEQTAIAREVHDVLGQALTSLRMDVSWIMARLPEKRDALSERGSAMTSLIDATLADVRQLVSHLRPAVLDDLGLEAAIEWQAQKFTKRTGVETEVKLPALEIGLDRERATAVFRVLQEALTNVARHAEASGVKIHLRAKGEMMTLEVRDDGKGVTDNALASAWSIGLTGMRERAGALGGRVDIRRLETGGTAVIIHMPLAAQKTGTNCIQ